MKWTGQPHFVPKGVMVFSTYPGWPREGRESKTGRAVSAVVGADGRVTWPGSGGYWKWYFPVAASRDGDAPAAGQKEAPADA